jgi:Trk K+ transport system NAD-binding subunit
MVLPRGPTQLQAGDQMIALAHQDRCQEIRVLLEGQN